MRRYKEPLNQYVYLTDLLDRNERLFYKLLSENVQELMPIVYTPTVGLACQKFGYTYTRPQVSNTNHNLPNKEITNLAKAKYFYVLEV